MSRAFGLIDEIKNAEEQVKAKKLELAAIQNNCNHEWANRFVTEFVPAHTTLGEVDWVKPIFVPAGEVTTKITFCGKCGKLK